MTVDWTKIELVIFDVDGTLYRQSGLRLQMGLALAKNALLNRDLGTPLVLRKFRAIREELAERNAPNFAEEQFALTAAACNCTPQMVREIVADWIELRPLAHIRKHRVRGIESVFDALRRRGKKIGILSDYPAQEKVHALGLSADVIVSAEQPDVMALKPNPAGISKILRLTGVQPDHTLMIGDRFETDWKAARAAGLHCLIRSRHGDPRAPTFGDYHDPCFKQLIAGSS